MRESHEKPSPQHSQRSRQQAFNCGVLPGNVLERSSCPLGHRVLEAPRAPNESRLRRALDGLQLNTIFTYASALPFNIQTGTDRNFDTNFNDRPPGVGRNTGRGFDYASLDLRLARTFRFTDRFRLEALAESFNTLNRANWQLPNNIYGAGVAPLSSFGKPTAASDPRQIQFGLRVMF